MSKKFVGRKSLGFEPFHFPFAQHSPYSKRRRLMLGPLLLPRASLRIGAGIFLKGQVPRLSRSC